MVDRSSLPPAGNPCLDGSIPRTGRIVLLAGPSGAGKSSIAAILVERLAGPWFHVPVDAITAMRSGGEPVSEDVFRRTRLGYHRVLAELAAAGNDVVADYPLTEPWRLDDLLVVLEGLDVTLVDVRCSDVELERRERERGDRPTGLALSQSRLPTYPDRDLVIDTTSTPAEDCARQIADHLGTAGSDNAFHRLRRGAP